MTHFTRVLEHTPVRVCWSLSVVRTAEIDILETARVTSLTETSEIVVAGLDDSP